MRANLLSLRKTRRRFAGVTFLNNDDDDDVVTEKTRRYAGNVDEKKKRNVVELNEIDEETVNEEQTKLDE